MKTGNGKTGQEGNGMDAEKEIKKNEKKEMPLLLQLVLVVALVLILRMFVMGT